MLVLLLAYMHSSPTFLYMHAILYTLLMTPTSLTDRRHENEHNFANGQHDQDYVASQLPIISTKDTIPSNPDYCMKPCKEKREENK